MRNLTLSESANLCAAAARVLPGSKIAGDLDAGNLTPGDITAAISGILAWASSVVSDDTSGQKSAEIVAAMPGMPDFVAARFFVEQLVRGAALKCEAAGQFDRRLFALAAIQGVIEFQKYDGQVEE